MFECDIRLRDTFYKALVHPSINISEMWLNIHKLLMNHDSINFLVGNVQEVNVFQYNNNWQARYTL